MEILQHILRFKLVARKRPACSYLAQSINWTPKNVVASEETMLLKMKAGLKKIIKLLVVSGVIS